MNRTIKYSQAIHEAFDQILANHPEAFIIGQGLWSPWYVGSTMNDLEKDYGKERILDSPISENAVTGLAIGSAMAGKRPFVVHPRMDFMLLAFDPLINQASNWSYLFNSEVSVPLVVRSIINRGGEQGAQHSQALQSVFMHVPGIKIVMPGTAEDAKGLLYSSFLDNNPVMYVDDRWCYDQEGEVSSQLEPIEIGKAKVLKEGSDITIVTYSYMVEEVLKAEKILSKDGLSIEIINLRTIKPYDKDTIVKSVQKTGRAIITDTCWTEGGVAGEISSYLSGQLFGTLKCPIIRTGLLNSPAPCASSLEQAYYPDYKTVQAAVEVLMGKKSINEINDYNNDIPGFITY